MAFHDSYSNLLNQLPPSLIKAGWIRLTTRKRNPLTESEASDISPIIEAFLKHEVDRYQRKKKYRYNPTQYKDLSISLDPKNHNSKNCLMTCSAIEVPLQTNMCPESETCDFVTDTSSAIQVTNSEEEINAQVREATNALRLKFIEASKQ